MSATTNGESSIFSNIGEIRGFPATSLKPARERGTELEQAITSMFAVMNVYTGDQAKLTLQVAEWCHYLEEFPLFAIRKAAKWTVVGRDKLPSVAAFIADVKLAIGDGVLERRQLLARISNPIRALN